VGEARHLGDLAALVARVPDAPTAREDVQEPLL
jgi:hypothetical protein